MRLDAEAKAALLRAYPAPQHRLVRGGSGSWWVLTDHGRRLFQVRRFVDIDASPRTGELVVVFSEDDEVVGRNAAVRRCREWSAS